MVQLFYSGVTQETRKEICGLTDTIYSSIGRITSLGITNFKVTTQGNTYTLYRLGHKDNMEKGVFSYIRKYHMALHSFNDFAITLDPRML